MALSSKLVLMIICSKLTAESLRTTSWIRLVSLLTEANKEASVLMMVPSSLTNSKTTPLVVLLVDLRITSDSYTSQCSLFPKISWENSSLSNSISTWTTNLLCQLKSKETILLVLVTVLLVATMEVKVVALFKLSKTSCKLMFLRLFLWNTIPILCPMPINKTNNLLNNINNNHNLDKTITTDILLNLIKTMVRTMDILLNKELTIISKTTTTILAKIIMY